MKNILTLIALLNTVIVLAQSPTGGVSINMDEAAPFEGAMLDVVSTTKGMLFPRMVMDSMNSIAPTTDGLLVYITEDNANKGYWYYDAGLTQWVKLGVSLAGNKSLIAPMASVVMYAGDFSNFDETGKGIAGTDKEGWAICNGDNNTPNMMERFVVGAKSGDALYPEYATIGNKQGADAQTMEEKNLPLHTHPIADASVSANHNHTVNDPMHSHRIYTTKSDNGGTTHLKRRDVGESANFKTSKSKTGITIAENAVTNVSFHFPDDIIKDEGSGATMDNRPAYYVVVYMMRTDGLNNFKNDPPVIPFGF